MFLRILALVLVLTISCSEGFWDFKDNKYCDKGPNDFNYIVSPYNPNEIVHDPQSCDDNMDCVEWCRKKASINNGCCNINAQPDGRYGGFKKLCYCKDS